jgi:hypothetical protein
MGIEAYSAGCNLSTRKHVLVFIDAKYKSNLYNKVADK